MDPTASASAPESPPRECSFAHPETDVSTGSTMKPRRARQPKSQQSAHAVARADPAPSRKPNLLRVARNAHRPLESEAADVPQGIRYRPLQVDRASSSTGTAWA